MRVLVVKPSSLGDVVCALAVVPRLRRLLPGCEIDWLINREYAALVQAAGVDRVIVFDRGSWRRWRSVLAGLSNLWDASLQIRRSRYALVLDLQGLLRSGWFTWVSGAPRRIGFADAREGAWLAYTERVQVRRHTVHAVDYCLAALRVLGDGAEPASWEWPGLAPALAAVREKTGLVSKTYFVLAPGSRRAEKRWPVAAWGELTARLWQRYHLPVALVGDERERELAAEIARRASTCGIAPGVVHVLAGVLNLLDLLALSRESRLFIGGDTGPLHAAVAAGAQVVALMGPTDPDRHGPYGQREHVVAAPAPCAPCHGSRRACDMTPGCMEAITVDAVMNKVQEVIGA
ncbi:MAG: glycosyltransferase family 9 protein [bacterium]|nr:glycosyltransferase family 9 protein [bacterium]